jgi:hypothetical protein
VMAEDLTGGGERRGEVVRLFRDSLTCRGLGYQRWAVLCTLQHLI